MDTGLRPTRARVYVGKFRTIFKGVFMRENGDGGGDAAA